MLTDGSLRGAVRLMADVLWTVVAESGSPDQAFAAAKAAAAQRGDVDDGIAVRTQFTLLDPTTLFPSDGFAAARAEDRLGTWVQPGAQPVIGPRSPVCWALCIRPQQPGASRLLFFGTRTPCALAARNVTLPLPTAPSNPADFRQGNEDGAPL
jgi:hypothetical protein